MDTDASSRSYNQNVIAGTDFCLYSAGMKRSGYCVRNNRGFGKRDIFRKMAEIECWNDHVFGIAAVAGHAHIPSPILTEGLSSAPAEPANFAGEIKMANHPIPSFDMAHFTADFNDLSCDFMS
jgi:hypothetical protein